MPRFVIELTHDDDHAACVSVLQAVERYGAHFFTHAEWGCRAGIHCAWMIAELDSREEALQLVPPQFRHEARIVELCKFTREEIASLAEEVE